MLNYKDIEAIYSNITIFEKFQTVGVLWAHRHDTMEDKIAYDRGKKELKRMVEGAKGY